jgi:predicted PurR-regulated permease PerM
MNQVSSQISKNILKALTAVGIVFFFAYLLFPFLSAMLMGAILALALSGALQQLKNKGLSARASLNYLIGGIFFILLAPTLAFFIRGSGVLTRTINNHENIQKVNQLLNQATTYIEKISPTLGLSPEEVQNYLQQATEKTTQFTLKMFSQVMAEVPSLFLFSVILLISTYFFLTREEEIRKLFDRYFYFNPKNGNRFVLVLQSCSREVFLSNVLTGLIQASVVTLGAIIFQYSEWFLIFFITFIASFIPIVGAGPIAFLLSLISFANGSITSGVGMLVISIISGTADNIIRPYLASRGTVEVPGVISFLAVIGGVITMGLPGLFLGPLIASLTFGALPILADEFLPEKEADVNSQSAESPDLN